MDKNVDQLYHEYREKNDKDFYMSGDNIANWINFGCKDASLNYLHLSSKISDILNNIINFKNLLKKLNNLAEKLGNQFPQDDSLKNKDNLIKEYEKMLYIISKMEYLLSKYEIEKDIYANYPYRFYDRLIATDKET